ncbi:hypothetical protein [Nitrosospira sp. NpAV]|uniref:hypothetical protein n=1 Tax=Nitrosospira sp. NpAV TaxID=58133 RepID=UPI0005A051DA|nr:hypothetical protein [Nitrosospira sp. NpAV]KIO48123.1 hypothetical protein SQ11_13140 [Nitrosospira sp. NpAV]
MKATQYVALASMLGLLAACAPMSPHEAIHSPVLRKAVQSARTRSDHTALWKHFEKLALEMRVKAEEQRQLLEHYQEKSYLYGRQAQDRQSHTWALMNRYELAVERSLAEADSHRRKAASLARDDQGVFVRKTTNAPTEVKYKLRLNDDIGSN